ncbi:MAG: hypothetical protein HOQ45_02430 [Nocardioidaceae bacterium]|nr:hypothetical protein [Dermatophilaceae bacterium]NUR05851.1 hypothetical protein [Nocardioidaceae bacterium]NUR80031.1 hypothetical protein [Dermatophilaceae bacterium]
MPAPNRATTAFSENVVASAARTASGNSGALTGWGSASTLRAQLNVTAASGTAPTLDVVLEDSVDGGTTWNTIGTFTQATTGARQVINVTTPFTDTLRVRWTVGGTTPSFTFAVDVYSE